MLIAEELVVLAMDPVRGLPVNGSRGPLATCLAGALVAELALIGAVVMNGRGFAVMGPPPLDGLLISAHQVLASAPGRRSADQLRRLDWQIGRAWKRTVDGLIDQGVLGRAPRGDLGIVAHPVLDTARRNEVVERVRVAAAGDGLLEPRTAVLLSLAGPARLLEVVADKPHAHARRRIAEAIDSTPVTAVVKQVLAEAAAAAALTAATANG